MLSICPGYRPADGDEPVARARRAKRRPRELGEERGNFPDVMTRIGSGLFAHSVRKNRTVLSDDGSHAASRLRLAGMLR